MSAVRRDLLGGAAGVQRLQVRLPGSDGNRVLIGGVTTPDALRQRREGKDEEGNS